MNIISRVYFKSLLVLFFLLTIILLFPPYEITSDYKTFDFVFNSESFVTKLNKTYSYDVSSMVRNLTKEDSIDAINIIISNKTDTIFNYSLRNQISQGKTIHLSKAGLQILKQIESNLKRLEKFNGNNNDLSDIANKLALERQYRNNPDFFKKGIDTIINYTNTKIEKPFYLKGHRKLLITQLIIEVLLAVFVSGIFFFILYLKNTKQINH